MTDNAAPPTVLDVVNVLDRRFPRDWAESWDRVGLVLGDLEHPVTRVLCVVDCVPETVDQALAAGADLIVAVCGGAGDSFLAAATRAGVDAYLCADLRHHPASDHLAEDGPALLDVAHWATERPWLDEVAEWLRGELGVAVTVSDVDTDPWTVHAFSSSQKETQP